LTLLKAGSPERYPRCECPKGPFDTNGLHRHGARKRPDGRYGQGCCHVRSVSAGPPKQEVENPLSRRKEHNGETDKPEESNGNMGGTPSDDSARQGEQKKADRVVRGSRRDRQLTDISSNQPHIRNDLRDDRER
jgi:hypothetical protein